MSKISSDHQRRILEATEAVARAESVLEQLLDSLEVAERADKKMIGEALRTAFGSLTTARTTLRAVIDAG